MFEVGKTYETKLHGSWKCIALNDTNAWLIGSECGVGYLWTHDGKSASLGGSWDIKPQPREFWIYNGYASEIYNPSPAAIHVREVLE